MPITLAIPSTGLPLNAKDRLNSSPVRVGRDWLEVDLSELSGAFVA